jgi:hypothetical protein
MPVISDLYSSKYSKPADLGGKPVSGTIKDVTVERLLSSTMSDTW